MEGLLDSSWEFIPPLFLRIPQLCSDWGRKGAEITFIHPKPSLERPSSLNLGGKGTTGFDGSLFSGLAKAAKLWDQLQEQFYKRDISKELLHAQTHKAGVNKHHEHKFSVLPIFMVNSTNKQRRNPRITSSWIFAVQKDLNSIQTLWQLPTQPEGWE